MSGVIELIKWFAANWFTIAEGLAAIVGGVSIIVRLTPTLRDDAMLLPIIKFLGKYIALDKYGPIDRPSK